MKRIFAAVLFSLLFLAIALSGCNQPSRCGDGTCNGQETQATCPQDCCTIACSSDVECNDNNPATIDKCSNPATCNAVCTLTPIPVVCGDGICNGQETQATCPQDCRQPQQYHSECQNQQCVQVEGGGTDKCNLDQDCIDQTQTGFLNVLVVDANTGSPVSNALVDVSLEELPGTGSSLDTNEDGLASFRLNAGEYLIEIQHPDYKNDRNFAQVYLGRVTEIIFLLTKLPDFECKELIAGHNNFSANKINLIFVGFGYEDINKIYDHAYGTITDSNFGLSSIEPYKSNLDKFNFWYITQSGSLSGDCSIDLNSSNYSCQDDVYIRGCPKTNRYRVHLVNGTSGGATGGNATVILTNETFCNSRCRALDLVHEFSHSFGNLRDEYVSNPEGVADYLMSGRNCYAGPEHTVSECMLQAPWKDLIGNGCGKDGILDCTPSDLDYDKEIGCYEGCNYLGKGIFRPTRNSCMVDCYRYHFFGLWNEKLLNDKLNTFD